MVDIYLTDGQKEYLLILSLGCNILFFVHKFLFILFFVLTYGFLVMYFVANVHAYKSRRQHSHKRLQ